MIIKNFNKNFNSLLIAICLFFSAGVSKADNLIKQDRFDKYPVSANKDGEIWTFHPSGKEVTISCSADTLENFYTHDHRFFYIEGKVVWVGFNVLGKGGKYHISFESCEAILAKIRKHWRDKYELVLDNKTMKVASFKKVRSSVNQAVNQAVNQTRIAQAIVALNQALLGQPQNSLEVITATNNYLKATLPLHTEEAKGTSQEELIEKMTGYQYEIWKTQDPNIAE